MDIKAILVSGTHKNKTITDISTKIDPEEIQSIKIIDELLPNVYKSGSKLLKQEGKRIDKGYLSSIKFSFNVLNIKNILIYISVYFLEDDEFNPLIVGEKMLVYKYKNLKNKLENNSMLTLISKSFNNASNRDDIYDMDPYLDRIYYKTIGSDLHVYPDIR